jgi:predicted RNase H-like HicB family nuclease
MWRRGGWGGRRGGDFIATKNDYISRSGEIIGRQIVGFGDLFILGASRMKSYVFKVVVEPDKFEDGRDAWHASCPALKGCHTWGHTYEEALTNIREAIDLYVQDLLEAGESIPLDQGTIELAEPAVVVNV